MFDGLNPEQRTAVEHGEGPLLVVAGPGSGKTTTLACRVACLIDRGIPPERILLLTFSRRAAGEMLSRARHATGRTDTGRVWGGTFHAVANRLLRLRGRALGLRPDFTVLDQTDAADVMDLLREELGFSARERRFPRKDTLAAIYSRTVNAGEKLSRVLARRYPWCLEEADGIRDIFNGYTERKGRQNVLDFDDLLLHWKALVSTPETREPLAGMFDHVLVDEYQDTNALQGEILEGMRPPDTPRNITVVGDDAQAIYGFRAATVRNILEFPARFPGTRVVKLERNYRSTPPILDSSNALIALSKTRHEKTMTPNRTGIRRPEIRTCSDEVEQSDFLCRNVLRYREEGVSLRDQAVLFRAAHHSDLLEVELTRRNIPFAKYGGLKFLESAHIKDALALLRVLENPWDEVSWFRVLQLPEGIGPAGARGILRSLGIQGEAGNEPSPLVRFLSEPQTANKAAAEDIQTLRSALGDCVDERAMPPAAQLDRLREFLAPTIVRRYDAPSPRIHDLEQLAVLAAGHEARGRFLAELTLDPPSSTGDLAGQPLLDEDWLVLSTMHSAKGLEWDVVHVIHAADGMVPSDMATGDEEEIEEERRLLYVAMTRARDALHVYFPLRYYRRPKGLEDPHTYAQLSRFLEPVRERFDEVGPDERAELPPDPDADSIASIGRAASVDAFLAGLWSD